MSSSCLPSMNHSMESATSSLHRSGLNMSVGDTKSIVLALQALQDKIRRLEQDRNHHQDQYERALQAHESYKHDMEHQLEQERAHHRQREKELQEMVQRATAEKSRLQTTLEESRKDLGNFRNDLEDMLVKEREAAQKREDTLSSEVEKLRRDVEEERRRHQHLLTSIDELRAEKDAALDTNHHLEQAVHEMLARGSRRAAADHSPYLPATRGNGNGNGNGNEFSRISSRRDRPRRNGAAAAAARRARRNSAADLGNARDAVRSASGVRSRSARHSYRDPTYSSSQRGVRGALPPGAEEPPLPQAAWAAPRGMYPNADLSFSGNGAAAAAAASPPRTQPGAMAEVRQTGAMAEVHQELQEELQNLHQQYKDTVGRAAAEEISPEVVTAALNHIATLMDRKTEQIRLIKEAQRDLAAAGVVEVPTSRSASGPRRRGMPVGSDKTTQRNLIVNELRSLFSQPRS